MVIEFILGAALVIMSTVALIIWVASVTRGLRATLAVGSVNDGRRAVPAGPRRHGRNVVGMPAIQSGYQTAGGPDHRHFIRRLAPRQMLIRHLSYS